MRAQRRPTTMRPCPLSSLVRLGLSIVPVFLATTAVSYSASATPTPPKVDQAFILEISAGTTRVAYSGACDVIDSMGAKRRKSIQGFTEDRLRFVGVEVSCQLNGQDGASLTATLRGGHSATSVVAQGKTVSVAVQ